MSCTLSSTTKDEFMTLIEDVQMATGDEVVVMGTKSALAKLSAMEDITYKSKNCFMIAAVLASAT